MSNSEQFISVMSLLHGVTARMASGPIARPIVERIDKALSLADAKTGLTPWMSASELVGDDQTFGRMLLEVLPLGFVAFEATLDGMAGKEAGAWPVVAGAPCRAEHLRLRFDAGCVKAVSPTNAVDIHL